MFKRLKLNYGIGGLDVTVMLLSIALFLLELGRMVFALLSKQHVDIDSISTMLFMAFINLVAFSALIMARSKNNSH